MFKKKEPLPCPKCGSAFVGIWWVVDSGKFFCECRNCHYCGRTKRFKWRAIRSWNKEEIFDEDTD